MSVEETLVIVKPDGVARNLTGEILRRNAHPTPQRHARRGRR